MRPMLTEARAQDPPATTLTRAAELGALGVGVDLGWFGLVGLAVAAMAIAMYVNDDPNATAGSAIA